MQARDNLPQTLASKKRSAPQTRWKDAYRLSAILAAASLIVYFPATARGATIGSTNHPSGVESFSQPQNSVSPKLARKLQSVLNRVVVDGLPPGMSVGIVTPQGTWYGASGIADRATGIEVKPSDRFAIGSVTKTFTAVTILKLAEEGKLSLDDTLGQWLPAIAAQLPDGANLTLKQLMNGTSGLYNFIDDDSPILEEIYKNPLRNWKPEELVEYAYGKERSDSWVYPNTGFILAGMVAEKATGGTMAQLMRDRILNPLGLANTFFKEQEAIPGGFVRGYADLDKDGVLDADVSDVNLSWAWAAGALVSNTADLLNFSQALFEGKLLSETSWKQMSDFQAIDASGSGYGLGLAKYELNPALPGSLPVFGHAGSTPGHHAEMYYLPEQKITVVALQNSQPANEVSPLFPLLKALQEDSVSVAEPNALAGLIATVALAGFCCLRRNKRTGT